MSWRTSTYLEMNSLKVNSSLFYQREVSFSSENYVF